MVTVVEWLAKELIKRFKRSQQHYTDSEWCFEMIKKLSEQAKEIEKQQIIDAYYEGKEYGFKEHGEQYYNETFKKPLALGMFVPCDEDGNILEEPDYLDERFELKRMIYQQAKERCLFEGCIAQKQGSEILIKYNNNPILGRLE